MYDLIIIGTGPAGYSAGIYSTRYGLKNLILGQEPGGMAATAHKVDNYPGFVSVSGLELMQKFNHHAQELGSEIKNETVQSLQKKQQYFEVLTTANTYQAKTLILAMGTQRKKMNIPGEEEFIGRGVSYCATCDAPFFKQKIVAVVGGGDAALQAAIQLAEIAKNVYLIYFDNELKAMPHWQNSAKKFKNIEYLNNNSLTQIKGNNAVNAIVLKTPYLDKPELKVDGVFIEIGAVPNSYLIKKLAVDADPRGYIKVDNKQATNVSGVFASGDISSNSSGFAQIITAAAEGALAAFSCYKYLKK